jgi:hypothetical protein
MSWFTRVLSCALTAAVVLLAALVLTSADLGCYDRGPWVRTTPYRMAAEEAERLERLEREKEETFAALRRRDEVLNAVIEGRCSLAEAAAAFWKVNRSVPRFHWERFRNYYPGATEAERCCRHVIRHVKCRLEDRPDGGKAVLRRLEAELEELLRNGPVRLPGVEEPPTP